MSSPPDDDILARIVASKRMEIAGLTETARREDWQRRATDAGPAVDLYAALAEPGPWGIRVIAEIKHKSPSAGVLRDPFDPATIAAGYERHGAAALSVLTDGPYFGGSIEDLRSTRSATRLPILRKEFILDPCQIWEAKLAGASGILLIAECLTPGQLADLVAEAHRFGLETLVELYDPDNWDRVLASGTRLIGINNRDLRTFVTDISHTLRFVDRLPPGRLLVGESGIRTPEDVHRLRAAGVHALLIGETFMRAEDPGAALAHLMDASQREGSPQVPSKKNPESVNR